jgi:hypothetical protein
LTTLSLPTGSYVIVARTILIDPVGPSGVPPIVTCEVSGLDTVTSPFPYPLPAAGNVPNPITLIINNLVTATFTSPTTIEMTCSTVSSGFGTTNATVSNYQLVATMVGGIN